MEQTNNNIKEKIAEAVKKIGSFMDLECEVVVKEEIEKSSRQNKDANPGTDLKILSVSLYIPQNARFLIGKNGQNLKSLEHLLRAMFLKNDSEYDNIVVDVNDYKKLRANYLVDLARQVVTRVRNTQKAEALMPMSGFERRIVHMELASYPDIATESIGSDPQRRIIIKPYP